MQADIKLGMVVGYSPTQCTLDVREAGGLLYKGIPYDPELGIYTTPVLPILDPSTGAILRAGSRAYLLKFNDALIKVLKLFNDDPLIASASTGSSFAKQNVTLTDPLLKLLTAGDTLVSAPGSLPDLFSPRRPGAWLLLKGSGTAVLSNDSSSAQFSFESDGGAQLQATAFRISALNAALEATSEGALSFTSSSDMNLESDTNVKLLSGSSELSVTPVDIALNAANIGIASPHGLLSLLAGQLAQTAQNIQLSASDSMTIKITSGPVLTISLAGVNLALPPGTRLTVSRVAADGTITGGYPVVCSKYPFDPDTETMEVKSVDDLAFSTTVQVG